MSPRLNLASKWLCRLLGAEAQRQAMSRSPPFQSRWPQASNLLGPVLVALAAALGEF